MADGAATVSTSIVESLLAIGGSLLALAATIVEWRAVSAQQVIQPLTVFYFVEAPALAWIGAWGLLVGRTSLLPWTMAGALFGFCLVGGFSIGPAYFPADCLLGAAVLWHDRRAWRLLPKRIGLAFLAAVVQAVLMLTVIRAVAR